MAPRNDLIRESLAHLFFEVNALAIRVKQSSAKLHRNYHLPPVGQTILKLLDGCDRHTVPDLARHCSTSRQNVQIIVNRLKTAGWVQVRPNPAHKRSGLVCLTESGKAVLPGAVDRERLLFSRLPAGLTLDEVQAAAAVLHRLRQFLGDEGNTQPDPSGELEPKSSLPALPTAEPDEDFPVTLL